jgi:hypothetical protein
MENPKNIMVTAINGTLSDTERDAFVSGVLGLESALPFGLAALSPSEVNRLAKAGPASASFVTDGLELASRNPELLTANVTPQEVKEKLQLIRNLDVLDAATGQLKEKLAHTAIVAKAEAYDIARTAYALLKRKKAAGLVEGRDKLAQRFKRHGNRKTKGDKPQNQS